MNHMEVQKIEQNTVVDITCDCCGKSCNHGYGFEVMTLSAHWGFGSNKDLQKWEAHLCEKCVDEKLKFIDFNKENYRPI